MSTWKEITFSKEELGHYSRHLSIPEFGMEGQKKLKAARVLAVGAGGLGAPMLQYLAAAGVGTIGLVDFDRVEASNLHRQVLFGASDVGRPKVQAASERLKEINPHITINVHETRLTSENALDIIGDYDLVADGTDNFDTRFLLNDACYFAKTPLVSAAALRFDGQLATYRAFEDGENRPCYRCVFGGPPPPDLIPSCSEGGVMGALVGTLGSLQATEVIKELLGIGDTLAGHLLIYDALSTSFRKVRVKRDRDCPLCGESPTITKVGG